MITSENPRIHRLDHHHIPQRLRDWLHKNHRPDDRSSVLHTQRSVSHDNHRLDDHIASERVHLHDLSMNVVRMADLDMFLTHKFTEYKFPRVCELFIQEEALRRQNLLHQNGGSQMNDRKIGRTRLDHSLRVACNVRQQLERLAASSQEIGCRLPTNSRDALILAALFHDFGHGPQSHLWETMMHKVYNIEFDHETMSKKIIVDIWHKHTAELTTLGFGASELALILTVIDPPKNEWETALTHGTLESSWDSSKYGLEYKYFWAFGIVSGHLDEDRCEYLEHDLRQADRSARADKFQHDLQRVNESQRVCWATHEHGERISVVAASESVIAEVCDVMMTRAYLHQNVYRTPTTIALELDIEKCIAMNPRLTPEFIAQSCKSVSKFLTLNDKSVTAESVRDAEKDHTWIANVISESGQRPLFVFLFEHLMNFEVVKSDINAGCGVDNPLARMHFYDSDDIVKCGNKIPTIHNMSHMFGWTQYTIIEKRTATSRASRPETDVFHL